jgi:hypothetical protein
MHAQLPFRLRGAACVSEPVLFTVCFLWLQAKFRYCSVECGARDILERITNTSLAHAVFATLPSFPLLVK